ncbi:hypothetical protein [uncultured Sulfitobacter sp.]|uniref:hypothetical protein n=1 Tax=uncultured Sulfitobacter sp. TaxID=191468 RepID=UPI0030DC2A1A|tara:strand:- start:1700 stop:2131 length:432 start_codon:yes stop_codon:yes gene_type:complete
MKILAPLFAMFCSISTFAYSDTTTDKLGSCLVNSTTGSDRVALARWIGFAIISHPSIRDSVAIPRLAIDVSDREIAELMTDLITVRCLDEARPAFADGGSVFEDAFTALGQVAMQELLMNQDVDARISAFAEYLEDSTFEVLE